MRWIFRLLGVVVVLAFLAVAALFLLPTDRIATLAAQQFTAATGRPLNIGGGIRPLFWPSIGARVGTVEIGNAEWSDGTPMITADSLDVGVDLAALWGGALTIRSFNLNGARITLERAADGRVNWDMLGTGGEQASGSPATGAPLGAISVDRATITDLSLRFIDRQAGTEFAVDDVDITLTMPDYNGPATMTLSANTAGGAIGADLRLGSVQAMLEGGVTALTARLTGEGSDLTFDGRAGLQPLAAEGRLDGAIARLAPLMALAGQTGPEPLPEGARPLALAGQITLAPAGSVHLRQGSIGIGANRLSAELDYTPGAERPRLSGSIQAASLDLRPFLSGGGAAAEASAPGWPTDRIDASALGAIDAQIGLATGPVETGFATIDRFNGTLTIDRARAVLALNEMRAFDGLLVGEMVANNRSGLSVATNLTLSGVGLMPLLRQTAGFERLTGTADAQIRLLGVGQSVDAIMRSLSGEGRLAFGAGEIRGFDLAGMLRNLDPGYVGEGNSTVYDSIGASFTLRDGVLRNEDLSMVAEYLSVTGRGSVDLGGQTLDYRVTPAARRNAQAEAALSVPLMITGPWSAPRFRLDLEGLAEQRLAEERERLEAAAREEAARLEAEARARLDRELGIERREGQSTEDAVRENLEDRAREGLLRLLGGGSNAAPATQGTTDTPTESGTNGG